MFSLICAWISAWLNNHEAGDLRRHRAHYDVTVVHQVDCMITNHATDQVTLQHRWHNYTSSALMKFSSCLSTLPLVSHLLNQCGEVTSSAACLSCSRSGDFSAHMPHWCVKFSHGSILTMYERVTASRQTHTEIPASIGPILQCRPLFPARATRIRPQDGRTRSYPERSKTQDSLTSKINFT